MNFADFYNDMVEQILERELTLQDGMGINRIEAAEQNLGLRLPLSLREYYRVAGCLDELNENYNRLYSPEELRIDDGYLVFMEENQVVVFWAVPVRHLCEEDPVVWQRVREKPGEWYEAVGTEKHPDPMSVSQFLLRMFLWTFGLDGGPEDD
ncbi:MAG TPA: hypothetical protein VF719_08210 [Abditibacteriaceae bacterium]